MDRHLTEEKRRLRQQFRAIRKALTEERRIEASHYVTKAILDLTRKEKHRWVLSFNSFADEIALDRLNQQLAIQHQLLLPRVLQNTLQIFHVEQPATDLDCSKWGIYEPIPNVCTPVELKELTLVLVPGLAFDHAGHRLGYGKGFYDRLLVQLPSTTTTIGVGFKEQLSATPLPYAPHDRKVQHLLLG